MPPALPRALVGVRGRVFLPAASLVWLRGRQAYAGDANRAPVRWQADSWRRL